MTEICGDWKVNTMGNLAPIGYETLLILKKGDDQLNGELESGEYTLSLYLC
jgi:hypothetical protein